MFLPPEAHKIIFFNSIIQHYTVVCTCSFLHAHRARLVHSGDYDQQRGGTYTIGGSGETLLEKQKRILSERELKLKKKLQAIKKRREHVRHERQKKHVPTVAVVGYTNAGS